MKKLLTVIVAAMVSLGASAQLERGVFNHLGVGVGAGLEGIGVNFATPITNYAELSAGVNFVPTTKFGFDLSVGDIQVAGGLATIPMDEVNVKLDLSRTTFDVKLSIYPFGGNTTFFIAPGLSFGGEKLINLTGHSEDVKNFMADPANAPYRDAVFAELDKYELKFDNNGDITGDVRVKNVRPYVGFGFGRLVPKKTLGFRFELGAQFTGKYKIYQNDQELSEQLTEKADDNLSKVLDKLSVYPVLKLTLTGKLF